MLLIGPIARYLLAEHGPGYPVWFLEAGHMVLPKRLLVRVEAGHTVLSEITQMWSNFLMAFFST